MKSLSKEKQDSPLPSWDPPELNSKLTANSHNTSKEEILAIFQREEELSANQSAIEELPVLSRKMKAKKCTAWEPGVLSQQPGSINREEWAFIEVSDTPFDKSWKVQSPDNSSKIEAQREIETQNILNEARLQAEEIILAAQAEADEILLQAQSEINEQKLDGYQKGRNESLAEIEDNVKAARKMLEELEAWKTDFLSQSEPVLIDMLKDISRKMFGEGVKMDPQTLHVNLNRIMANAHGLGALKIFLNPNDAKQLNSTWEEQQMLSLGEQVRIIPSGNVLPGGCLIKGNIGTIDARVETQLGSILKTFDDPDVVESK